LPIPGTHLGLRDRGSVDLGKLVVIEDVEEFGAEIEEGPSP
jgi:hypothetical protein